MAKSPIILGNDLSKISSATLAIVKNKVTKSLCVVYSQSCILTLLFPGDTRHQPRPVGQSSHLLPAQRGCRPRLGPDLPILGRAAYRRCGSWSCCGKWRPDALGQLRRRAGPRDWHMELGRVLHWEDGHGHQRVVYSRVARHGHPQSHKCYKRLDFLGHHQQEHNKQQQHDHRNGSRGHPDSLWAVWRHWLDGPNCRMSLPRLRQSALRALTFRRSAKPRTAASTRMVNRSTAPNLEHQVLTFTRLVLPVPLGCPDE